MLAIVAVFQFLFDLAKEKHRVAEEKRMAKHTPERKAQPDKSPMPTPPMPTAPMPTPTPPCPSPYRDSSDIVVRYIGLWLNSLDHETVVQYSKRFPCRKTRVFFSTR